MIAVSTIFNFNDETKTVIAEAITVISISEIVSEMMMTMVMPPSNV